MVAAIAARVLVIEDDEGVAAGVVDILGMEGHGARWALAAVAVDVARDYQPDMILLDLMMPGLDGFAVAELLRDDPATRDIPVVVMTARRDATEAALRIDAVECLTKPFDLDDLLSCITRVKEAHGVGHE